jgi:hypothetical protein
MPWRSQTATCSIAQRNRVAGRKVNGILIFAAWVIRFAIIARWRHGSAPCSGEDLTCAIAGRQPVSAALPTTCAYRILTHFISIPTGWNTLNPQLYEQSETVLVPQIQSRRATGGDCPKACFGVRLRPPR